MHALKNCLAVLLLATASSSVADTLQYATENGAIDGYDPVAYFVDGKAQRGLPHITTEWNGATWRFVTEEHRVLFSENPEKYAPQYGGFCALGMAHGGNVPTDPEAWTIWEGKLYLNMIQDVTITWRYNPDRLTNRADLKWAAKNDLDVETAE